MDTPIEFDSLWDYNNPAATEIRFRELLAQITGSGADSVEVMTQIARTQGLQGKFEEAHSTLDEVKKFLKKEWTRAYIRYLLERGRVYNTSGHGDVARSMFLDAWNLAANAPGEESLAIDAAHMMGIVEPLDKQIAWNLQAVAMAESSSDEKAGRWKASLYNNIGWSYHDQGDFEKALEYFQKAQIEREARQSVPEIRIAKWCVARTLRSLGRIDEALQLQQQLAAEMEADGSKDGFVNEEIGECLLLMHQPENAADHFALAHEQLSQDSWLVQHEPARLERILALSNKGK